MCLKAMDEETCERKAKMLPPWRLATHFCEKMPGFPEARRAGMLGGGGGEAGGERMALETSQGLHTSTAPADFSPAALWCNNPMGAHSEMHIRV